ncbi:MAG TPA: hypothetical protein PKA31_02760 [Candidatus Moranbacteria bacterium]|nr:hypothetical protein [Candidatus Moranbacteria bacterium]
MTLEKTANEVVIISSDKVELLQVILSLAIQDTAVRMHVCQQARIISQELAEPEKVIFTELTGEEKASGMKCEVSKPAHHCPNKPILWATLPLSKTRIPCCERCRELARRKLLEKIRRAEKILRENILE